MLIDLVWNNGRSSRRSQKTLTATAEMNTERSHPEAYRFLPNVEKEHRGGINNLTPRSHSTPPSSILPSAPDQREDHADDQAIDEAYTSQ
jgi:hypothetical protein